MTQTQTLETEEEPTSAMPVETPDPAVDSVSEEAADTAGAQGEEPASEEQKPLPWWQGVVEFVVAFAVMVVVIMGVRTFVIEPFEIPSGSMLETIQIGDRIFAEKVTVAFDPMPEQGEIVTFVNPRDPSEILIKRVIATEGQTIDFRDGVVYIDGVALDEPYTDGQLTRAMNSDLSYSGAVLSVDPETLEPTLNEDGSWTNAKITYPYTVPEGYFWAMGDNRGNSADSRVFGPVNAESVTGRAVLRYWPLFYITGEQQVEVGPLSFDLPTLELAVGPLD